MPTFYSTQSHYLQGVLEMRISVERGREKGSHFPENGETDQDRLTTSPKCLSYTNSELKIKSHLIY